MVVRQYEHMWMGHQLDKLIRTRDGAVLQTDTLIPCMYTYSGYCGSIRVPAAVPDARRLTDPTCYIHGRRW